MKKFNPQDTVIAINDTGDDSICVGDRCIVKGYCDGCGGLIVEGSTQHFPENDFELYRAGGYIAPSVEITEEKILAGIRRIASTAFMYSSNGFVHTDVIRHELYRFADGLGLKEKLTE